MDDDAKLIADLYYDSGLSKDTFNKVYLSTLKKYLSKINSDSDNSILKSIKIALRKRRSVYLPDGVCAEEIHSSKDVWTFIVFLSGLIIPTNTNDTESILNKILDSNIHNWLKDKKTEKAMYSICDSSSTDINVQIIRGFYGVPSEHDNKDVRNTSVNDLDKLVVDTVERLTNKDLGKLFIHWMLEQAKNTNEFVFTEGQYYFIKSPLAFIEFSKIDKHSWKAVQKGVFKLSLHEINEENGTPFHKVNGANMMKFDLAIKSAICNHADFPSQIRV